MLSDNLLAWYGEHGRDLPWRQTRDPYAIWVSEIMLQQTRVETVLPYYQRFMINGFFGLWILHLGQTIRSLHFRYQGSSWV